jgi:hypothetical protein
MYCWLSSVVGCGLPCSHCLSDTRFKGDDDALVVNDHKHRSELKIRVLEHTTLVVHELCFECCVLTW